MSVDIASLAIKIDATSAATAAQSMDKATDSGAKLETQLKKTEKAAADSGKAANENAASHKKAGDAHAELGKKVGETSEKFKESTKAAGEFGRAIAAGKWEEAAGSALRLAAAHGLVGGAIGLVAAAAVKGSLDLAHYAEDMHQLEGISKGVGAAMGLTAQGIRDAAAAGAAASHESIAAAREQALVYARTGAVTAGQIQGLIALTERYSFATGTDAKEATQDLAKAMADPAKGAEDMAQSLGILNGAQVDYIKGLAEAGDKTSAQAALQSALNDKLADAYTPLHVITDAWNGLKNAVEGAYEAMLHAADVNILGGGTMQEKVATLRSGPAFGRDQRVGAVMDDYWSNLNRSALAFGNQSGLAGNSVINQISGAGELESLKSKLEAARTRAGLINPADLKATQDAAVAVGAYEHAIRTWIDPEEKRIKLMEADARIAEARNRGDNAGVRQATRERTALSLSGEVVTDATAGRLANLSGDTVRNLRGRQNEYEADITRALQAEAQAHKALASGLEQQLTLQLAEIQAELETAKAGTEQKVRRGALTRAQADQIEAVEKQTADYKTLAAQTANELAIVDRTITFRDELAGYAQRETAARAGIATSAEAINRLEAQALAAKQGLERQDLKSRLDARITAADPAERARLQAEETARLAGLDAAQAAEKVAADRKAQARVIEQSLAIELNALSSQRSLLDSEAALARTGVERRHIAEQQLALDRQAEHARNVKTIGDPNASLADFYRALTDLGTEGQRFGNQLKALNQDNWARDFHDAQGYINQFAQGLAQDDWPEAFLGLSLAIAQFQKAGSGLEKVSAAAGAAYGIGQAIGGSTGSAISRAASAAEFGGKVAGPEGAVIAAAVSVLGSLLGGNHVSGVVHLDAKSQQALQGVGSVLGDIHAQSQSIGNSLANAEKYQDKSLGYSNDMVHALRDIDNNIGHLTSLIARQLGVSGALGTSGLGLGTTSSRFGLGNSVGGAVLGAAAGIGGSAFLLSGLAGALALGPIGLVAGAIGAILGALVKSTVTSTLTDQGLAFRPQTVGSIAAGGVAGQTYQDVSVSTHKSLFGIGLGTSTKNLEVNGALPDDFARQTGLIVESLRTGVLTAAATLGLDGAQAAVDAFNVDLGRVSLKDLKPDEIQAQLEGIFSKLGDDIATAAAPTIAQFQKAGEGAFQTLARLATDYAAIDGLLASVGKTFGAVGQASIGARENLVDLFGSLDTFSELTNSYAENFLTEAQRMAPVQAAIVRQFQVLGVAGVNTKAQFKQLVDSLDLTTEAGQAMYAQLLGIAPAFAKVADFLGGDVATAVKSVTDLRQDLVDAYGRESDALKTTIASLKDFRASLEGGPNALLSPEAAYLKAQSAFNTAATAAQGGDPAAAGSLATLGQSFLDASRTYYASSGRYFADLAAVKSAVDATSATATGQLSALDAQVQGLITINASVISVHDAVVALQAALTGQAANGAGATPFSPSALSPSYSYTPPTNAYTPSVDNNAADPTIDPSTGQPWGYNSDYSFDSTGSFKVGGTGPQRFGPATFHGGEIVEVKKPYQSSNDNGGVIDELRALRSEVSSLRQQLAAHGEATVDAQQRGASRVVDALDTGKTARLASGGSL
jgi:hypothetical protein